MPDRENLIQIGTNIAMEKIKDYIINSKTFLDCIDSKKIEMYNADEEMEIIDDCFYIAYDEMIALQGEVLTVDFTISNNSSIYSDDI